MTSPWDDVFNSLVLEPDFREYESAPKHVRERLAAQLAMSLEQYDEKLHWGFSEFYDQEYMTKNWIAKAIKKPKAYWFAQTILVPKPKSSNILRQPTPSS